MQATYIAPIRPPPETLLGWICRAVALICGPDRRCSDLPPVPVLPATVRRKAAGFAVSMAMRWRRVAMHSAPRHVVGAGNSDSMKAPVS